MGDDDDEGNSCVICCEPLSTSPIGTTVPCGHVFHFDCFGEWGARNSSSRHLKCPICNGVCSRQTPFVRLFVNLAACAAATNNTNDDETLDSEEDDEVEEEAYHGDNNDMDVRSGQEGTFSLNHDCDDDDVVLAGVKVDANELKATNSSTSKHRNHDALLVSLKKKYRALKARVKQLEMIRDQLTEQHQSLNTSFREVRQNSDSLQANLQELTEQNNKYRLEIQDNKVALRRHASLLEKCTIDTNNYRQQAAQALAALNAVQEGHQQALREAHSSSLAEVRELRREHNKLSTKHQIVTQNLAKQNDKVISLQRRVKDLEEKLGPLGFVNDAIKHSYDEHHGIACAVSLFRKKRALDEGRDVAREERKELQRKMCNKGSDLAARMCRASEKKIASASSSTTTLLDRFDVSNRCPKKSRIDHSIQIKTTKTLPSFVRRKETHALTTFTTTKRSVQNDIRDMFQK